MSLARSLLELFVVVCRYPFSFSLLKKTGILLRCLLRCRSVVGLSSFLLVLWELPSGKK